MHCFSTIVGFGIDIDGFHIENLLHSSFLKNSMLIIVSRSAAPDVGPVEHLRHVPKHMKLVVHHLERYLR